MNKDEELAQPLQDFYGPLATPAISILYQQMTTAGLLQCSSGWFFT
jgi:hypothetical protein